MLILPLIRLCSSTSLVAQFTFNERQASIRSGHNGKRGFYGNTPLDYLFIFVCEADEGANEMAEVIHSLASSKQMITNRVQTVGFDCGGRPYKCTRCVDAQSAMYARFEGFLFGGSRFEYCVVRLAYKNRLGVGLYRNVAVGLLFFFSEIETPRTSITINSI